VDLEQTMLEFYQQFYSKKKLGVEFILQSIKIILLPAQQKIKSISYIPNSSRFRVFRFRTLGKGRILDFDPRVKRKGTDTQYDS
jgi:hypothetical protein